MEFKFLDEELNYFPDLRVLERSNLRHSVLMYQHTGSLRATAASIGNLPGFNNAESTVNSFFRLAKEGNQDLVLTPEYCCPWQCVSTIIENEQNWPSARKLWVIGCESITKDELTAFDNQYQNDIIIHYDHQVFEDIRTFFDPVLYIFLANVDQIPRLHVVVQFKTFHMSVWSGGEVERDNMIEGKTVYLLRNNTESINFITLICSEAMNFASQLIGDVPAVIGWLDRPFLIFNPQLNGQPIHENFRAFRRFVMGRPKREIISLNWSMNSKIGHDNFIQIGTSRSGFIVQSNEVELKSSTRLRKNHADGMYYFNFGIKDRHAFILNSFVEAFHIENTSIDIIGVEQQQARRDGPEVIASYVIDANFLLIPLVNHPSDRSIHYLNEQACANNFLLDGVQCVLEKERLASLSALEIAKGDSEWYAISNLLPLRLDEQIEVNKRLTFAEDTTQESEEQRRKYIRAISELQEILSNRKDLFPESIKGLHDITIQIGYDQAIEGGKKNIEVEKYKYNVTTEAGLQVRATICYLDHPSEAELKAKYSLLQELFGDNPRRGRIVIFYRRGQEILKKWDDAAGKITSGLENGPDSIF